VFCTIKSETEIQKYSGSRVATGPLQLSTSVLLIYVSFQRISTSHNPQRVALLVTKAIKTNLKTSENSVYKNTRQKLVSTLEVPQDQDREHHLTRQSLAAVVLFKYGSYSANYNIVILIYITYLPTKEQHAR